MADNDEWGRDPSIQIMRKVFKKMETSQEGFFNSLNISPYDSRIRAWRERALIIFEKMWGYAAQRGIMVNEEIAGNIYIVSLARVVESTRGTKSNGIEIPKELIPDNREINNLFKEAFK